MTIVERSGSFGVKTWDRRSKSYRWIGTFPSLKAAEAAERDATVVATGTMPTVAQWSRAWLSDHARPSASTRMVYRQETAKIVKSLGETLLCDVSKLDAFNLAKTWPRNTSAVARTMWADAIRLGLTKDNPFADLRLPHSRGRKDIVALTESELVELSGVALVAHKDYGATARAIVLTLGYTGVRPGELCGLRWDDLDLRAREMHVRRSVDLTGVEKLPKNGKPRLVTVPPAAADALSSLLPLPDGYVFHSKTGKRLNTKSLWYVWQRIAGHWEAAGHEPLEMYSLRHACATILLERGLSASDVGLQLGHGDGGILVATRYGHPDQALTRDRLKMAFAETPQEAQMRRTA